jgi:hypothetical protein
MGEGSEREADQQDLEGVGKRYREAASLAEWHHGEARVLRAGAERHRVSGNTQTAEQKDSLADIEDALAEYETRLGQLEDSWVTGGWKSGSGWEVLGEIRSETRTLESTVVKEGEDPLVFDKWLHSPVLEVERELRKARARLAQYQKLEWRAEILAELGQEATEAERAGTVASAKSLVAGRTFENHEYWDAMQARLLETFGARPEETP